MGWVVVVVVVAGVGGGGGGSESCPRYCGTREGRELEEGEGGVGWGFKSKVEKRGIRFSEVTSVPLTDIPGTVSVTS